MSSYFSCHLDRITLTNTLYTKTSKRFGAHRL